MLLAVSLWPKRAGIVRESASGSTLPRNFLSLPGAGWDFLKKYTSLTVASREGCEDLLR